MAYTDRAPSIVELGQSLHKLWAGSGLAQDVVHMIARGN